MRPVVDVAVQHAERSVTVERGARVFGRRSGQRRMTIVEAAELCGMSPGRFSRLRCRLGLGTGEVRQGRPIHLDKDAVLRLKSRLDDSIDLSGAAALLGVGTGVAADLVEVGLLSCIVRGGKPPLNAYTIERAEVLGLIDKAIAMAPQTPQEGSWVALTVGAPQAYLSVVEALAAVLDGRLKVRGIEPASVGLGRVLVSAADLRRLKRGDERGLTLNEIAKEMRTNWGTVRDLVRLEKLAVIRTPVGWEVSREEIERFRCEYVWVTEVAEMLGTDWKRVAGILAKRGILPAISREECRSVFYARARVAGVQGRDL